MFELGLCRMKKRNGWSAVKCSSGCKLKHRGTHIKAVAAAAASVPSSFTSTKDLWTIVETKRSPAADMPDRSALPLLKRSCTPRRARWELRTQLSSSLNLGNLTWTSMVCIFSGLVHSFSFSKVSCFSICKQKQSGKKKKKEQKRKEKKKRELKLLIQKRNQKGLFKRVEPSYQAFRILSVLQSNRYYVWVISSVFCQVLKCNTSEFHVNTGPSIDPLEIARSIILPPFSHSTTLPATLSLTYPPTH